MKFIRIGAMLLIPVAFCLQDSAHAIIVESEPAPACGMGEVVDSKSGRCMASEPGASEPGASEQGASDAQIMVTTRGLLDQERFAEAEALLDRVTRRNSPTYLNYRGFVTRKLGRPEEAIGYYQKALLLDPYYAEAREYLGEAYIMLGRRDLAEEQLGKIRAICGQSCEAYVELRLALDETLGK